MEILNHFNVTIKNNLSTYDVLYIKDNYSGSCTYEVISPLSKKQNGNILLLIKSDMGDVIEYINKISPLSSKDFNNIQMGIRNHSLSNLKSHLQIQETQ